MFSSSRVARGSQHQQNNPITTNGFDKESGQVFKDTEVRFNRKQHSDWICEEKTPGLFKRRQQPNGDGARSLFEMATNKVARNIRSLDVEHFSDAVPWEIAEKVWDEVVFIRGESVHAWRTMARVYSQDFNSPKNRYKLDIKQPSLPLTEYFRGINSPLNQWLTCLRISPKQITTTDLVAIAKITNLVILDLSDGQLTIDDTPSTFNERIMKTWSELAVSHGAFKHLRVLLLGWQDYVSDWIFKYLAAFPSLCHVLVTDCAKFHPKNRLEWEKEAETHGWEARRQKNSAKSLRPILDDKTFYLGAVSGCYYESQGLFEKIAHRNKPEIAKRLPALECWIGSPRPWSHIIDEFPGARTIWLDNSKTNADAYTKSRKDVKDCDAGDCGHLKRDRDSEVVSTKELRSPPLKRTQGHLKPKRAQAHPKSKVVVKPAKDLLDQFSAR